MALTVHTPKKKNPETPAIVRKEENPAIHKEAVVTEKAIPHNPYAGAHASPQKAIQKTRFEDIRKRLELEEIEIMHKAVEESASEANFLAGQIGAPALANSGLEEMNRMLNKPNKTLARERQRMENLIDSYTTHDKREKIQKRNRITAITLEIIASLIILNTLAYVTNKHVVQGYMEPLYFLLLLIIPHWIIIHRIIRKYQVY